jgi:protein-tyrosine phosphatase
MRKADQILSGLWLGCYLDALDWKFLNTNHIGLVVNLTTDVPCLFVPRINYIHLPIRDAELCRRHISERTIGSIIDAIETYLGEGYGVLVHCKEGHHRSAGIVLAYLMKYHQMSYSEGIRYIQSHRPKTLTRSTCLLRSVRAMF